MRTYLAAFVVAAVAAALLTPLARRLAFRWGAVSRPGGRHVHRSVVPRLGGVAIYFAVVLPLGALFFVDSSVAIQVRAHAWMAGGLLVGATSMAALGILDDTRGLRAVWKLLAQLVVAAFAFACGFRIEWVTLPVLGNLSMGIFAFPVTVLWITGIINAVNLIDGLDGLAAGVVLFAALTNFVIANITGSVFIAFVMAAIVGALLGFLLFNFNPARIFMGDSGSYLLGYVLATSVLAGATEQKASTAVSLLVPCLALGVPIFDTLFSMVRRILERRSIFSPDRGHIHHRLLDMGLTHRRAVLTIYAVSAVFSVAAIAISIGKDWQIGAALLVSSAVLFALVRAAGYFDYLRRHMRRRGRIHDVRADALRRALPDLAERLALASDDEAIQAALEELVRMKVVERVALTGRDPRGSGRPAAGRREEALEAAFPIGTETTARADAVFTWSSVQGVASPETEIMLEVLVEFVERALLRTGSLLASKTAAAPIPSSAQPATVAGAARVAVSSSTLGS
jgi:UDP-GlcNAc:undecaprenyl-phosphate GlcNAc-1-phosphate transferase